MNIIKTSQYKLKNSKERSSRIDSWIGATSLVYNIALEIKIYAWKSHQKNVSRFDLQKQLIELKQDYDWIRDVQSQVLQTTIQRLDKTYQSFFRGGGFTKWAKKDRYNSLCFPQGVKLLDNYKIFIVYP